MKPAQRGRRNLFAVAPNTLEHWSLSASAAGATHQRQQAHPALIEENPITLSEARLFFICNRSYLIQLLGAFLVPPQSPAGGTLRGPAESEHSNPRYDRRDN